MIKKIGVDTLQVGMFISDLNCSWINHPFVGSGKSIKVDSKQVVEKILGSKIKEVFIDTEKGLDVGEKLPPKPGKSTQPVKDRHAETIEPSPNKIVSISEEIFNAKKIKSETVKTVKKLMDDVKMGRQIECEKVEEEVDTIIKSVFRNSDALMGLARLRSANDFLYSHSLGVCIMTISFCKHLGFDANIIREVGVGALLHDIGATKIPQYIVNKKSDLSDVEYGKIKKHVQYGRRILEKTKGISELTIRSAYEHHERIDGSGYPLGIKGDQISLYGQVIGIVDVYDALTTQRSYRHKIQPTQALKTLYEWKGKKFNSELIQSFIRCVGIYPVGTLVALECGMLGVVLSTGDNNLLQPVVRVIYDIKKEEMIVPFEVDLAQPSENKIEGGIKGYENPDKWNIQPEMYL